MNRRKFIYNSSLASLSVMGLNSCNLNSKNLKITILHTNDVHSQIEQFPSNHNLYPNKGGFARRADLINETINLNPKPCQRPVKVKTIAAPRTFENKENLKVTQKGL